MPLTSPADEAYARFKQIVSLKALFKHDDKELSESDTRAKFIDPIFRDVLGWSELEIRREKPAKPGYADYVLGIEFSYVLVEAKRTKPRFRINVPTKSRVLKLSGPHLLNQKKVEPHIL